MNIVLLGDSLTRGATGLEKNLPQRLCERYPRMNVVNLGVGGDTTADMLARVSAADKYKPFRVWVWAGINDVSFSVSAVTIKANLQSIYTYYASTGIDVWALTITPTDDNTSPMLTVRDDVNNWIKNTATGINRIVDTFTIIADPSNTNVRLPAYAIDVSQNHINDLGMAAIIEAAEQ